jgi:hypothetical protein
MITCQERFFRLAETNLAALCGYHNSDDEDTKPSAIRHRADVLSQKVCVFFIFFLTHGLITLFPIAQYRSFS